MGDKMRDEVQAVADFFKINPLVIPMVPDIDMLNQAIQDALSGRYPDTGG